MARTGRDVHDGDGRHSWLGPRAWVAAAACATMLAAGGTQYGYGVLSVRLWAGAHVGPQVSWGFAAWMVCQSAAQERHSR